MGKASRRRTRGGRHTHTDYNMLRAAYEYEHMDNYVHQRRMRQTTIPVSQYDPPVPWLDIIGDIPILGKFIVLYIIMPILMLIVKIGEWRLENWRTDEDALVEFLSLPSRRARPFFHLHVFIHKSLMGPEGSAFCIGMDVASRRSVFCLTFDSRLNGADLVRKIIKEICQSVIRENNDNPMNPPGKPYMLTTPDHFLYTSFVANFQRHGITILRTHKSGAQMMIIGEDRQNPVPLRAIAEALAATLDRDSGLMLKGEDLPPSAAESFRPSTKEPGTFRSTVKRNLPSHQRLSSAANVTIYSRWRN